MRGLWTIGVLAIGLCLTACGSGEADEETAPGVCVPDSFFCGGGNVLSCNREGTAWQVFTPCQAPLVCYQAQCVEASAVPADAYTGWPSDAGEWPAEPSWAPEPAGTSTEPGVEPSGEPGAEPGVEPGAPNPAPQPEPGQEPDPVVVTGEDVDPNCIDGQYSESLPNPSGDVTALLASFSPANYKGFIYDVLDVRYPLGSYLIEGGLAGADAFGGQDCVDAFLSNSSSATAIIDSLSTLVHECGHFFDIAQGGFSGAAYILTKDLQFTCTGGSIPAYGGKTFARSLIKNDEYAQLYTPCESWGDSNCEDTYAGLYLNGDPTDSNFDSGDQGFDMLFEEVLQYVNSLATSYAFADFVNGSTSARDGILVFLWYLERYLRMARLQYPEAYTLLSTDSCWRRGILQVWGRAWLYLGLTEGDSKLGIDANKLIELVRDPELLGEIELLRQAEGCQ